MLLKSSIKILIFEALRFQVSKMGIYNVKNIPIKDRDLAVQFKKKNTLVFIRPQTFYQKIKLL